MRANSPSRSTWFALFVLLTASAAAPLNQFKVPPVLPLLMDAFSLSFGRAGLLMSVFALTGLILALPVGFIFQKLGYRITGLLAVGSVIVGASIGAVSTGTGMMLMSRVIEGLGMSFMTVVAPAVIAIWFAADERGTPMGIWATWVPLGSSWLSAGTGRLCGGSAAFLPWRGGFCTTFSSSQRLYNVRARGV
jgi:MFS family permease